MKETSGEFSMTVVVIIGAILIVAFLTTMVGPMGNFIQEKWQDMVNDAGWFLIKFLFWYVL